MPIIEYKTICGQIIPRLVIKILRTVSYNTIIENNLLTIFCFQMFLIRTWIALPSIRNQNDYKQSGTSKTIHALMRKQSSANFNNSRVRLDGYSLD